MRCGRTPARASTSARPIIAISTPARRSASPSSAISSTRSCGSTRASCAAAASRSRRSSSSSIAAAGPTPTTSISTPTTTRRPRPPPACRACAPSPSSSAGPWRRRASRREPAPRDDRPVPVSGFAASATDDAALVAGRRSGGRSGRPAARCGPAPACRR